MATLAQRLADFAGSVRDKLNLMTPRLLPAGGTAGQALLKSSASDYAAAWATIAAGIGPTVRPGNWFLPYMGGAIAAGAALTASRMFLTPVIIWKAITIQALGARVTGNVTSSLFSLAIYAHNPVGALPTGLPLASVSGLSGAGANTQSAALAANVTLQPGIYWMAVDANAAITLSSPTTASFALASIIGANPFTSASLGAAAGSVAIVTNAAVTQGTFPDFTGTVQGDGTFNYSNTAQAAAIFMQAA